MDSLWQIGLNQLMSLTSTYTSGWTSASANFGVMEMYSNNNNCASAACTSSTTTPGGDVGTNYDDSLGKLSQASYIPKPGNGTNQPGDTPQVVLFIVTDGVEDEQSGSRRFEQAMKSRWRPERIPLWQRGGNQLVHDDQESRHSNCDPLHRLFGGAGQQLVREPRPTVPVQHRTSATGLRLARTVLRRGARRLESRSGSLRAFRRDHPFGPPDPVTAKGSNRSKPGPNFSKPGQILQSLAQGRRKTPGFPWFPLSGSSFFSDLR